MIGGIEQSTADLIRAFDSRQWLADNSTPHLRYSSPVPVVPIVPVVPPVKLLEHLELLERLELVLRFYSSPSSPQRLRTFCDSSRLTVLISGNSTPLNFDVASMAMRDVKPCLTSGWCPPCWRGGVIQTSRCGSVREY